MPPTFGWRRVVELADEFKVSTADMLAICDRLGVIVEDASEWLDLDTVELTRNIVGLNGPKAVLSRSCRGDRSDHRGTRRCIGDFGRALGRLRHECRLSGDCCHNRRTLIWGVWSSR